MLAAWLGNQWRIGTRARESLARVNARVDACDYRESGPDRSRAAACQAWGSAAVNRVIPNLLAVREGRLDLAVAGDCEAAFALLHLVGRMIGRPFDRPLPVWLSISGASRTYEYDTRFKLFDTLFERCDTPDPGRRLLLFLALAPEDVSVQRIDALTSELSGASGLAVVPEPADAAQRVLIADQLLEAGWLPMFVEPPGKSRKQGATIGTLDSERLGRMIHEMFLENAWTRGERLGATPALHPWRRLDETYRNANRSQAAHIAYKLAYGGLIATPEPMMADGSQEPVWSRPDFIEPLSRMEHDRWASDRLLDGWVYGATRDNAARRHPDLIPYDDLSEEIREKDRVAVATIPFILQLGDCGWRPLVQVRLAGRWPDPREHGRLRRRWRRDLRRVAEERAPAVLEFLLDPAASHECQVGIALAKFGFPVSLRLSEQQPMTAMAVDAASRAALIHCLSLCRQVVWDEDWPLAPLTPAALEAMVAERGGLRVERHLTGGA